MKRALQNVACACFKIFIISCNTKSLQEMKHFAIFVVLAFVAAGLSCDKKYGKENDYCEPQAVNFDRLMTSINLKKTAATFNQVFDPNHTRWKDLGIASSEEIAASDVSGWAYFDTIYGINFDAPNVTVDPSTGARTIFNGSTPLITWIPYELYNPSYRVAFDSENMDRGGCEWWFIIDAGAIAQFFVGGTFSGGEAKGTRFFPGTVISYSFYYVVRKVGTDGFDLDSVEPILVRSRYPVYQVPNSQGFNMQVIGAELIDERGNVGCASVLANSFVAYNNSADFYTVTNNVMRWPCKGLNPLP